MKPFQIRTPLYLLAALLLMGLIAFQWIFFMEQKRHARQSRNWVTHTDKVLDTIENMFGRLRDAELGARGFLITGYEDTLNPYRAALGIPIVSDAPSSMGNYDARTLPELRADIRRMIADNPAQSQRFRNLEMLIDEKLEQSKKLIGIRRSAGEDAAIAAAKQIFKQYLMKFIRIDIAEMVTAEETLLNERIAHDNAIDTELNNNLILAAATTYGWLLLTLLLAVLHSRRAQRAESRLLVKESHFQAVAEGGMDAFFLFRAVHDQEGVVRDLVLEYANPVASRGMKAPRETMLGHSLTEVMPHDDTAHDTAAYIDIFRAGKPEQHEYCVIAGTWKGLCFQRQTIPLVDGIAILCRDITERKQMEEMKNEFISTVSHELRTPLTSIRGSLGLILGGIAGPVAEKAQGLLAIAHNNCERLVRLINDILDIEKIESGGMEFQYSPVAVVPLLRQILESNQAYAEKYQVGFQLEVAVPEDARINIDPDRLTQVVTNLLSNAAKFSPEGGIVRLRCLREGKRVRIEVVDKGSGIAQQFQGSIFERFRQGDASDTRQKGGTGLGLSIVKAITESMGGTVNFESAPGFGSRFWVSFPLLDKESTTNLPAQKESYNRPRILVCEDDPDVAQFIALLVDRAGCAVDIATSARQAVQRLVSQEYAAMTLDLLLPDTYGMELLRDLRADPKYRQLPVVVISARAEMEQKSAQAGSAGVLDWITKPIDTERLITHIQNLTGGETRPRILHVEDDDSIAEVLRLTIAPFADVVRVSSLGQARGRIDEMFDLVVLDVGLPDGMGTDLLPQLAGRIAPIPIVLFTASDVTPRVRNSVAASLIKSRTSEEALLATIRGLIGPTQTQERTH